MNYVSGKDTCPLPYSPSKSYTVPRPIGWLSIVSKDGVVNFAPYSQWPNLAYDLPISITDVFEMKVLGASDSITAGLESETG